MRIWRVGAFSLVLLMSWIGAARAQYRYWDSYDEAVRGTTIPDVLESARSVVLPDDVVWVVVGDREKIEAGIRELGFGEVRILDPRGRVTGDPAAARR